MQAIDDFAQSRYVRGRSSIADLFPPGERCGLYILHFANGEIYAGQASDVTRRYVQHRKVHTDIEQVSFRRVAKNMLDKEERKLIWELEQSGHRLRNVTFTSLPKGESDFDVIMSAAEQELWLHELRMAEHDKDRLIEPGLRRKYRRTYEQFVRLPHAHQAINVLRTYVGYSIPVPRRGEVSFWAVSCLPNQDVYARINVYWQEVFTLFLVENELWLSLHMADSSFAPLSDEALDALFQRHPAVELREHRYKPGGSDQTNFLLPAAVAVPFFSDPEVLPAIRLFNLRLMKKGPCNFGRYHCMDLADELVGAGRP